MGPDLGFIHRYHPGPERVSPVTLLLLHGTGGNEEDLLPLASMLAPEAGTLGPRGKVLEHGMPRYFRRLAEGVFDVEDLKIRTSELAAFVEGAATQYGFDPRHVYAVGFSNGANIAASVLLRHPGVLAGGILFRAMLPLELDTPPPLSGTRVFLGSGRTDPLVPAGSVDRLAALLREGGAEVTHAWVPGGHELTAADVSSARDWLAPALVSRGT